MKLGSQSAWRRLRCEKAIHVLVRDGSIVAAQDYRWSRVPVTWMSAEFTAR